MTMLDRFRAFRHRTAFKQVEAYCLFIGYPRSGHSLTGSLLDAHPEVVIAHELDSLGLIEVGISKPSLYTAILDHDRDFTDGGRQWMGYEYIVPNQWQGRYERLRVIGDKKGGDSTERLGRNPAVLDALRQTVQVPLRAIHVIRNPFDNITTMARRTEQSLDDVIDRYFRLVDTVQAVRPRFGNDEWIDIHHEGFVAEPASGLTELCRFVGVRPTEQYIADCVSLVFDTPRQTRSEIEWSDAQVQRVLARSAEVDFLAAYSFV